MEKHIEKFTTKNLFIATYLLASGKVTLQGLQILDAKTKLFVFTPFERARELEQEYFSGGALPVKTIFAEYNTLKDMLFDRETNGEKYYAKK